MGLSCRFQFFSRVLFWDRRSIDLVLLSLVAYPSHCFFQLGLGLHRGCSLNGDFFGCPGLGQVQWKRMPPRWLHRSLVWDGWNRCGLRFGLVPVLRVWVGAGLGYHLSLCRYRRLPYGGFGCYPLAFGLSLAGHESVGPPPWSQDLR